MPAAWKAPTRLLGPATSRGCQTYRMRISVAPGRSAGLSEWSASVNLVLVGSAGEAALHTLEAPGGAYRFAAGATEHVEFEAPDVGPIECVWVAPTAGTLEVSRAEVFVGQAAAPVALVASAAAAGDAVSQLMLPPAPRRAVREEGLAEYSRLKERVVGIHASLVGLGTAAAVTTGHADAATAFAAGGAVGLLYLQLLQLGVDAIPGADAPPIETVEDAAAEGVGAALASPAFRLAAVGTALLALAQGSVSTGDDLSRTDFVLGVVGFLTYKLAVVGAALTGDDTPETSP